MGQEIREQPCRHSPLSDDWKAPKAIEQPKQVNPIHPAPEAVDEFN
jgi:hypothetical protein